MKTIFVVVALTVIFIIGMVAIEKNRTQGLNEVEISYQQALKDLEVEDRRATDEEKSKETEEGKEKSQEESKEESKLEIQASISGAVKKEGTYTLTEDSCLADLLELAGGLKKDADESCFNLDYLVQDDDDIYIPSVNSFEKISINEADAKELDELPTIGATLANRIIEYREQNGDFTCLEQIKNVEGIGDSKFEKLKDRICL